MCEFTHKHTHAHTRTHTQTQSEGTSCSSSDDYQLQPPKSNQSLSSRAAVHPPNEESFQSSPMCLTGPVSVRPCVANRGWVHYRRLRSAHRRLDDTHTRSFSLAARPTYTEKLLTTEWLLQMLTCGSVTDLMVQWELACAIHTQTHSLTNMPSDLLQKERENQCCVFQRALWANWSHSLHQPATKTLYTSSKRFIPNHF